MKKSKNGIKNWMSSGKPWNWNTKEHIKRLLELYIRQIECNHEWIDPCTYENELDKNYLYCNRCQYKKRK